MTSTSSEASSALELQHTKVGITFRLATTKPCKISMYWGVPASELDAMLAPESACTEAAAVESSSALTLATDDDRELAVVVVDPATPPSPSPDIATDEGASSPAPAPSITELVPADSHVVRMAAVDESMSDAADTIARPASSIERLWHQATGWLPRSTASGASGTTVATYRHQCSFYEEEEWRDRVGERGMISLSNAFPGSSSTVLSQVRRFADDSGSGLSTYLIAYRDGLFYSLLCSSRIARLISLVLSSRLR